MKIKIFILFLPVLFISCNPKTADEDFFLKYDQSVLNDKEKEKQLDSLSFLLIKQSNDSAVRSSLFRIASRYERLGLDGKYYNTVNKIHLSALEKSEERRV